MDDLLKLNKEYCPCLSFPEKKSFYFSTPLCRKFFIFFNKLLLNILHIKLKVRNESNVNISCTGAEKI